MGEFRSLVKKRSIRNHSRMKAGSLMLIVLVTLMPVLSAYSQPITSTVVVRLSDDAATQTAITRLSSSLDDVLVVDFSFLGRMILMRAFADIVWVSHGDENGISTEEGNLTWEQMAQTMNRVTPARTQYVASCHSGEILEQSSDTSAIVPKTSVFQGVVDADFIGGWIAAHILIDQGNLDEAQDVLIDSVDSLFERVQNDELQPLVLEGNEILWAGIAIAFVVLSVIVGKLTTSALKAEIMTGITKALAAGLLSTIVNLAAVLVGVLLGQLSVLAFIFALVPVVLSLIFYILISIPWYKAWIIGVVAASLSTPYIALIGLLATWSSIVFAILGVVSDWIDSGDGGQATTFWG